MNKEDILDQHASERTKCTVYTRVMGYHRPVETFNTGKQGEFQERKHFHEPFSHHEKGAGIFSKGCGEAAGA